MKNKLAVFPFHPFLLAIYSPLALYSHNVQEVAVDVLVRPLVFSLALAALLLLAGRVLFGRWHLSALFSSIFIIPFFTYGHLYNFLKSTPSLVEFARHRYLVVLALLILAIALLLIWQQKQMPRRLLTVLNLSTAFLLVFPLLQSSLYAASASRAATQSSHPTLEAHPLVPPEEGLPSIYLIVLDAYMRSDALQRDVGFDNTAFVTRLEEMGFYIPRCSRPNYDYTMGSLTATLNMDYLEALSQELAEQQNDMAVFGLIKKSKARSQLEAIGYRTAALDSGYEWSRIYDADMYLAYNTDPLTVQALLPFENMLLKSTALRLLTDYLIKSTQSNFILPVSQFSEHISVTHFSLSTLPALANENEPLFVFAHILIPHWPYIFLPDGSIRDDPVYTTEDLTQEQRRIGYVDSIQYINGQILPIIEQIQAKSKVPPVIILMGDHGLTGDNRMQNFAAISLPGSDDSGLYAHITSVNYFRVIFNALFGAGYPLLPDITFMSPEPGSGSDSSPYPESAPECMLK